MPSRPHSRCTRHKCDVRMAMAEAVLKGDSQALYHLQPYLHSDSDGDDADDNGRPVLTSEFHAHTSMVNAHSPECLSYHDSAPSRTHLSATIFQDKRAVPNAPLPCGPPASPPPQAPRLIGTHMVSSSCNLVSFCRRARVHISNNLS